MQAGDWQIIAVRIKWICLGLRGKAGDKCMRRMTIEQLNEKMKRASDVHRRIASRRTERPSDNKPRDRDEFLLLVEIAERRWKRDFVKLGERKWRYIGE